MDQAQDIVRDLERRRQALEQSASRLRASLVHWQQWYLEYSALKEEVVGPEGHPSSRVDLARIRRDFEGELVNRKEVDEIIGKNDLKTPEQIVSVLSRRIDYVERNVATLTRQLEAAESELAATEAEAAPDPDVGGGNDSDGLEDGDGGRLPITDIVEELDDDDNVVNFHLQTGGDAGPKVLEALEKAGLNGLNGTSRPARSPSSTVPEATEPAETSTRPQPAKTRDDGKRIEVGDTPPSSTGPRKSVSFTDDTKPAHDAPPQQPISRAAQRVDRIMQAARDQALPTAKSAVIPADEAPEDAQLRRQMLEYGMSEIAPVVAELQLDEDGSGDDDDDGEGDYSDEDWEEDEDEDEDGEDELGRSKYSVITDDYRQRMQELEKRLGVQSAFAAHRAPKADAPKTDFPEEGIGRISVSSQQAAAPAPSNGTTTIGSGGGRGAPKKGVRFAQELDVASGGEIVPATGGQATGPPAKVKKPEVDPLSDVVERTSRPSARTEPSLPAKKPSRFKKEQGASSARRPQATAAGPHPVPSGPHEAPLRFLDQERPAAPSGPDDQTLADVVVEKETPPEAREPDEFDATLLRQEAAVEYGRMRSRLIQKQGGFARQEDLPEEPLDEEEGVPKRMSRFRAARLSKE